MITKQDLTSLGFKEANDLFSEKKVWILGKEIQEICGNLREVPMLYYNMESQTCKISRGEFCVIHRICKTEEEIREFINCINFLFNISIVSNDMKGIEDFSSKTNTEML